LNLTLTLVSGKIDILDFWNLERWWRENCIQENCIWEKLTWPTYSYYIFVSTSSYQFCIFNEVKQAWKGQEWPYSFTHFESFQRWALTQPNSTQACFWPTINPALIWLWPWYFLTRREINEKFGIFGGNFPDMVVADKTWPNPST